MLSCHTIANGRYARILRIGLLLLLQILVVRCHLLLLLVCHVSGMHSRGTGDIGLLSSIYTAMAHILWCLRRHFRCRVNAVLASRRIGGIEAGLEPKSSVVSESNRFDWHIPRRHDFDYTIDTPG